MARKFIEGWESGANSGQWDSGTSIVAGSSPPAGFNGTYYGQVTDKTGYITFDSNQSELYIAFKIYQYTLATRGILIFKDSAGTKIASLTLDYSVPYFAFHAWRGAYTQNSLELAAYEMLVNTTYLVEIYYKPLNSGGQFQVKVDGVLKIDFTGDTTNGLENVKSMLFGTDPAVYTGMYYMDDLVIDNSDWIGNTRIQKLQIDGIGNYEQWDRSAGSNNYENVDEIPPSDTDYNYTNVQGEIDSHSCANMTGNVGTIKGLVLEGKMSYDGNPTPTGQRLLLRINGSDYVGSQIRPGVSFAQYANLFEVNPDDSQPWEEADINAIEIGYKAITYTTTTTSTTTTTTTTV